MAEEQAPLPIRAIDSNVLLRYFLNDVADQAQKAHRLVDSHEILGITAVALAEVAWTLTGLQYRQSRVTVATLLSDLLARRNIVMVGLDKAETLASLELCALTVGAPNLGDAILAACARSNGVTEIYTFDARFSRTDLTSVQVP